MNHIPNSVPGVARVVATVRAATFFVAATLLFACPVRAQEPPPSETTVGMPAKLVDLILPGTPLKVIPVERNAAMVVRILQTIGHGEGKNRYEIEYYCLEPGSYNLADYFERIDGTATDDLPTIPVTVNSQLPEGQVKPHQLLTRSTPRVGGYKNLLIIGGVVWVLGLLWLLFGGRKQLTAEEEAAKQVTLAERMRPLVESAMNGELDDSQQAELERMLLTYWRDKLDLNDASAAEAITTLRNHETAGELLRQLEGWLHMPAARREKVDVNKLLAPYRNLKASDHPVSTAPASVGG